MSHAKEAFRHLAERLNLDPQAAQFLPESVHSVALKLKITDLEVVEVCRYTPGLMSLIANDCRQHVR